MSLNFPATIFIPLYFAFKVFMLALFCGTPGVPGFAALGPVGGVFGFPVGGVFGLPIGGVFGLPIGGVFGLPIGDVFE
jgi:hypothetical protein